MNIYIDDETKFIPIRIYKKKKRIVQQHYEKKAKENTFAEKQTWEKLKTKTEEHLQIFIKYKLQYICRSFYWEIEKKTETNQIHSYTLLK